MEDLAGAGVERFGAGLVEPVGEELTVTEGVSRIAEGEGILIASIPIYDNIL